MHGARAARAVPRMRRGGLGWALAWQGMKSLKPLCRQRRTRASSLPGASAQAQPTDACIQRRLVYVCAWWEKGQHSRAHGCTRCVPRTSQAAGRHPPAVGASLSHTTYVARAVAPHTFVMGRSVSEPRPLRVGPRCWLRLRGRNGEGAGTRAGGRRTAGGAAGSSPRPHGRRGPRVIVVGSPAAPSAARAPRLQPVSPLSLPRGRLGC